MVAKHKYHVVARTTSSAPQAYRSADKLSPLVTDRAMEAWYHPSIA